MLKSKKFIVISVIAAVVLIAGVAGVALAQTGSAETQAEGKTLLGRVATILGIEQQKVEDAFKQATREMADEGLDAKLKAMVENGRITQEQADQYKSWWQARPDTELLAPKQFGRLGGRGFGPGMRWCVPPGVPPAKADAPTIIE